MKVLDILSRKGTEIYHISPDSSVYDAISLMAQHNVGALLVMQDSELKGILSERDYRNKVILMGRTSKTTRVKEIMTVDVFCVNPSDTIETCMAIMTEKKFRHLPIMNNNSDVIGVISIGDLVKTIIDRQKVEIKDLKGYIRGMYPQ